MINSWFSSQLSCCFFVFFSSSDLTLFHLFTLQRSFEAGGGGGGCRCHLLMSAVMMWGGSALKRRHRARTQSLRLSKTRCDSDNCEPTETETETGEVETLSSETRSVKTFEVLTYLWWKMQRDSAGLGDGWKSSRVLINFWPLYLWGIMLGFGASCRLFRKGRKSNNVRSKRLSCQEIAFKGDGQLFRDLFTLIWWSKKVLKLFSNCVSCPTEASNFHHGLPQIRETKWEKIFQKFTF